MCGIVGYIGPKDATPIILNGLRRLEYRGYDSAGLAVQNGKDIVCLRSVGKIAELERKIGRGTHHSAVPVQDGDRVPDPPGKEQRSAVRLLCGELPEEGRSDLQLPAQLPLLDREKVGLEASAREQDLPRRQEENDGQKGAQEKSSDGQLSPSGTLKR